MIGYATVGTNNLEKVTAFYDALLGKPGIRGREESGFYGAYFRDLDGNKLCIYRIGAA